MPTTTTPTDAPAVIESASATTSPDNANSGPFAYVLFGIVAACLLGMCILVSSCAATLRTYFDYFGLDGNGGMYYYPYDDPTYPHWNQDWDYDWDYYDYDYDYFDYDWDFIIDDLEMTDEQS